MFKSCSTIIVLEFDSPRPFVVKEQAFNEKELSWLFRDLGIPKQIISLDDFRGHNRVKVVNTVKGAVCSIDLIDDETQEVFKHEEIDTSIKEMPKPLICPKCKGTGIDLEFGIQTDTEGKRTFRQCPICFKKE
jgi:hypothetical protein